MHLKGMDCLFTPVQGPSTRAWKSQRNSQHHRDKAEAALSDNVTPPATDTHPVLVDDIHDGHQLASMGSERDVGNTADLNEAFEHLGKTADTRDESRGNGHGRATHELLCVRAEQGSVELTLPRRVAL